MSDPIDVAGWSITCSVADGILASGVGTPEDVLDSLAGACVGHRHWLATTLYRTLCRRLWTKKALLADRAEIVCHRLRLDPPENQHEMLRQLDEASVRRDTACRRADFYAELLLERRHASVHDVATAVSAHLGAHAVGDAKPSLSLASLQRFWSLAGPSQTSDSLLALLNELLALPAFESPDDTLRFALAQALLRRLICWPLFVPSETIETRAGLAPVDPPAERVPSEGVSLPIFVCVDHDGRGKTYVRRVETSAEVSDHDPVGLGASFARACSAAKDTWLAKHGRVALRFRQSTERSSVTFDLTLAERALLLTGQRHAWQALDSIPQRSLEAYMGQAVLGRLLHRTFGARTVATGTLRRPDGGGRSWGVTWELPEEPREAGRRVSSLVQAMIAKAHHAGGVGAYDRMVVPAAVKDTYQRVHRQSHVEREFPHMIGVTTLARCADLCIPGPWRPERLVRSEHLAFATHLEQPQVPRVPEATFGRLRAALSGCRAPGFYVRTNDPNAAAHVIAAYILRANADYRQRSHELARVNTAHVARSRKEAPTAIGWMAFRCATNELGVPFFASLYYALAGRVDGAALEALEATYAGRPAHTMADAVHRIVADWLNHTYSESEPWQAPELAFFYDVGAVRRASEAMAMSGGVPIDPWRTLLALPPLLDPGVCDERHAGELGKTRLIVIDDGERLEDRDLPPGWEALDLLATDLDPPRPHATSRTSETSVVLSATLGLLREPAPAATVMSVVAAFGPSTPGLDATTEERLFRDVMRQAAEDTESRAVVNGYGLIGLPPAARHNRPQPPPAYAKDVLLRAHLAAAGAYAPWLGVGALLNHLQFTRTAQVHTSGKASTMQRPVFPVPPDEWFLPPRLTEVEHHLFQARALAGMFRDNPQRTADGKTLEGALQEALERLALFQYRDPVDRVHTLMRYRRDGTSAAHVWRHFVEGLRKVGGLDELPFTVLRIGLRCAFAWLRRNAKETPERRQVLADAQELIGALTRAVSRTRLSLAATTFMGGTAALASALLSCHGTGPVPAEQAEGVREHIARAAEFGVRFAADGDCFEALGDYYYALVRDDDAASFWYRAGVAHAPEYQQCFLKRDALAGARRQPPHGLPDHAWNAALANLSRWPSSVPRFKDNMKPLVARCRGLAS